jgi:hypothetical protein
MNRRMSAHGFYLPHPAVFFLCLGIFAGTLWANGVGRDWQEQTALYRWTNMENRYVSLFLERAAQAGFAWLLGMSLAAVPGFCILAFGAGFSMAFVLSCMTVQNGLMGLPLFLASLFPHFLFYIPVGAILTFWGLEKAPRPRVAGFCVLLAIIAAGAGAETFLNPWIMKKAWSFFSLL